MYATHQPPINKAMRTDLGAFKRAVLFAVLSARTQFVTVPDQLDDVRANGAKSKHLFSWKRTTYHWLEENASQWRDRLLNERDTRKAMIIACECPGLNLVKGAFILQFLGHDVACMDTRNEQRESGETDRWKVAKGTKRWFHKLDEYIAYTEGRARELWDTWCYEIGEIYGMDGEEVSAIHEREICNPPKRAL